MFLKIIHPKFYLQTSICLILVVLGAFTEAIGLGLVMPLISIVLQQSSDVGLASYISSYFQELGLVEISVIILILFTCKFILNIFRNYFVYGLEWYIRRYWMISIFNFNIIQDFQEFESQKPGHITNTILNETLKAASAFRQTIEFFAQIMQFLAFLIVLILSEPKFSLVILIFTILLFICLKYGVVNRTTGFSRQRQEHEENITHNVTEMINGMASIRSLKLENYLMSTFERETLKLAKLMQITETTKRLPLLIVELTAVVVFTFLIFLADLNKIELASKLPFLGMLFVMSVKLLNNTGSLATNYISIKVLWESVIKISNSLDLFLSSKPNRSKISSNLKNNFSVNEISCVDLEFSYKNGPVVIKKSNFNFKKGNITSISGESGSGKSTIAKLLLNFYLPVSGTILIDSKPLENLDISKWRGIVGYVDQNPFFFFGTMFENLTLGNSSFSNNQISQSIKSANIEKFLSSLPNGLQTCLGDKGNSLSGGQKARLALARTFLRNPKILVLDEITGPLDNKNKKLVLETLSSLKNEMIIIIITHDKEIIKNSDVAYEVKDHFVKANKK